MKLNYKKSQSNVRPDLVDDYSSKTTVYIRRNIIEKSVEDKIREESRTVYEYDEAKLTKEEYEQYLKEISLLDIEQQRADIDYLAFMTGIDLGES